MEDHDTPTDDRDSPPAPLVTGVFNMGSHAAAGPGRYRRSRSAAARRSTKRANAGRFTFSQHAGSQSLNWHSSSQGFGTGAPPVPAGLVTFGRLSANQGSSTTASVPSIAQTAATAGMFMFDELYTTSVGACTTAPPAPAATVGMLASGKCSASNQSPITAPTPAPRPTGAAFTFGERSASSGGSPTATPPPAPGEVLASGQRSTSNPGATTAAVAPASAKLLTFGQQSSISQDSAAIAAAPSPSGLSPSLLALFGVHGDAKTHEIDAPLPTVPSFPSKTALPFPSSSATGAVVAVENASTTQEVTDVPASTGLSAAIETRQCQSCGMVKSRNEWFKKEWKKKRWCMACSVLENARQVRLRTEEARAIKAAEASASKVAEALRSREREREASKRQEDKNKEKQRLPSGSAQVTSGAVVHVQGVEGLGQVANTARAGPSAVAPTSVQPARVKRELGVHGVTTTPSVEPSSKRQKQNLSQPRTSQQHSFTSTVSRQLSETKCSERVVEKTMSAASEMNGLTSQQHLPTTASSRQLQGKKGAKRGVETTVSADEMTGSTSQQHSSTPKVSRQLSGTKGAKRGVETTMSADEMTGSISQQHSSTPMVSRQLLENKGAKRSMETMMSTDKTKGSTSHQHSSTTAASQQLSASKGAKRGVETTMSADEMTGSNENKTPGKRLRACSTLQSTPDITMSASRHKYQVKHHTVVTPEVGSAFPRVEMSSPASGAPAAAMPRSSSSGAVATRPRFHIQQHSTTPTTTGKGKAASPSTQLARAQKHTPTGRRSLVFSRQRTAIDAAGSLVVIDGSNVAFGYRNDLSNPVWSPEGILQALKYFRDLQVDAIAFVPRPRVDCMKGSNEHEKDILAAVARDEIALVTTKMNDDVVILQYAIQRNGHVVSNDQFRDHHKNEETCRALGLSKEQLKAYLADHQIYYTFARGDFLPNPEAALIKALTQRALVRS